MALQEKTQEGGMNPVLQSSLQPESTVPSRLRAGKSDCSTGRKFKGNPRTDLEVGHSGAARGAQEPRYDDEERQAASAGSRMEEAGRSNY